MAVNLPMMNYCITYNDKTNDELLHKDNSFTILEGNIQALAIEMYKIMHSMSPVIMKLAVPLKETNRYFSRFPFKSSNVNAVRNNICPWT